MKIYDLIKILGIATSFSLTVTFILGFFNLNIKNRILLHKIFAMITLFLGLLHSGIIFYINYIK